MQKCEKFPLLALLGRIHSLIDYLDHVGVLPAVCEAFYSAMMSLVGKLHRMYRCNKLIPTKATNMS